HKVAVQVAGQGRRAALRRRAHEGRAAGKSAAEAMTDLSVREVYGFLEEELARLPEKYRTPLVEHYLLGKRQEVLARELGWSLRTLTRRLEAGRLVLHKRLAARGASVPGVVLVVLLAQGAEAAPLPVALTTGTLRAVML